MIELSQEQMQAVEQEEPLPVLVNPKTRKEYVLIPKERFEAMQKWIAPLKRRWDDPADDDLIKKS
jgi:PHD/YefM family antitoxin component YafN of YafNO toxin-antitoxin module